MGCNGSSHAEATRFRYGGSMCRPQACAAQRWAFMLQYIERYRILLSSFMMPTPTIQSYFPSMALAQVVARQPQQQPLTSTSMLLVG